MGIFGNNQRAKWHYCVDEVWYGPYTRQQIKKIIQADTITPETLIAKNGRFAILATCWLWFSAGIESGYQSTAPPKPDPGFQLDLKAITERDILTERLQLMAGMGLIAVLVSALWTIFVEPRIEAIQTCPIGYESECVCFDTDEYVTEAQAD